jgi:periplasmic protein CpxP/Spy
MLKHSLLALMLAGVVYTAVPFAVAQDSGSNPPQSAPQGAPPDHGRGGRVDPAMRTERLTKELKLTSDQQTKVLDILKSAQSKMQDLRSDTSVPQEDRRSKMMEIHKASNDQIRALLDANQQKKFDAMQSRHEQWQGRRPDGQGTNAPDSTPQN